MQPHRRVVPARGSQRFLPYGGDSVAVDALLRDPAQFLDRCSRLRVEGGDRSAAMGFGAPGRVMLRIAATNSARSSASRRGSLSTPASEFSPVSYWYTDHGHGYRIG